MVRSSIPLPTLTKHREDIEALVLHFFRKHLRPEASEILQVAPSVLKVFKAYPWPGNVRELENVIERASHLVNGQMLLLKHLPERFQTYQNRPVNIPENDRSVTVSLDMTLEEVEETFIRKVLASLEGNRSQTAKSLGIGRSTLQRKLKRYN